MRRNYGRPPRSDQIRNFVRCDSMIALSPTLTKDYFGDLIKPKDDDEYNIIYNILYIDVRVTNIKLLGKILFASPLAVGLGSGGRTV